VQHVLPLTRALSYRSIRLLKKHARGFDAGRRLPEMVRGLSDGEKALIRRKSGPRSPPDY